MRLPLAFRLAGRELRGGVAGLRIVLACLALGVAAIAAVGSLRAGIEQGLARDGARILGGDLEIRGGAQPLPPALDAFLRARGARLSHVVTLRSMLVAASGARVLVELKAVDGAWPLVGSAGITPQQPLATALDASPQGYGLLVEPVLLDRLGLRLGDVLTLGRAKVVLRGVLEAEPDRVASFGLFGLRAMVSDAVLPESALLAPGAIAEYRLRAKLPQGADPTATAAAIRHRFGDQGWRIRLAGDAAPGVSQFIDRTSLFMTLVGLTALLVGGIGVANGVRAWLEARARSIATLRCLGASSGLVFAMALIQVMALAALGVLLGLVAGALLPLAGFVLLRDVLPVPPVVGLFPAPLALAALYGLLTAAAFALWPLGRAMRIPGAALFRDTILPAKARPPGWLLAANLALVLALVALTVILAPEPRFALGFCAAALATLALFRAGGWLLMRGARLLRPARIALRLGVGNLHRPGAPTPLLLTSLGIGLSTLAAVALIQANLRSQLAEQMPERAPSFFFIDIQDSQMPRFRQVVEAEPLAHDLQQVPSLRARVVSVGGIPAERVAATPDTRWALRGDRGLTYAAAEPAGTTLVAGRWWPADYAGPPLLSFDAALAQGWGLHVGDHIRLNVLGRDIDYTIANLRRIDWRSLGINFTMIATPNPIAQAPHSHIATVRVDEAGQARLLRAVTDALPNVSGIRVADVLATVAALLGQLATALAATGSLTLVAGALVLAGAVAAGQRRRIREAVILKTIGATRSQIRAAWLVEFGLLGLVAGLLAALVGSAASWAVLVLVMHTGWAPLPGTLALVIASCVVLMLVFGYAGTEAALRAKAAPLLRNE